MKHGHLIIRADASANIGVGHLMRCVALAQAWKAEGGRVIFVTACDSDALRQRLLDEDFQVVIVGRPYPDPGDWEQTSRVLAAYPGAWLVLDGYHFDADYQRRIKEAGHQLLVIDDMAHLDHYYADIVLNQNIHAEQLQYSCEPYTRLLLGSRYVLLRTEFLKWRSWRREIPEVARKILVTLGGGDPDNVTLKVIRALQQVNVDELEATVVVGGSNPHYEELQSAVQDSRFPICVESNVTNMPDLMAWAHVTVSAGGSTVWELAFMGVPVIGLSRAEQEEALLQGSTKSGISVNLGRHCYVEPGLISEVITDLARNRKQRLAMSRAGRSLVDGLGRLRVIDYMEESE